MDNNSNMLGTEKKVSPKLIKSKHGWLKILVGTIFVSVSLASFQMSVSANDTSADNSTQNQTQVVNNAVSPVQNQTNTTNASTTKTADNSNDTKNTPLVTLPTNTKDSNDSKTVADNNQQTNVAATKDATNNSQQTNVVTKDNNDNKDPQVKQTQPVANNKAVELATVSQQTQGQIQQAAQDSSNVKAIDNNDGINAQTATKLQAGQEFNKYRQQYHYSDAEGAGNDVQTIWQDSTGLWHFYYLHSDTRPDGVDAYRQGGWAHVTSSDLIHFQDCGTAIPGVEPGLWTATWTGSIITNANGFFKNLPQSPNVVVACISTPRINTVDGDTGQNLWLLQSLDGGYHFTPMEDHPITGLPEFTNGYEGDNRDPAIWYNSETNQMEIWIAQDYDHGVEHVISQFASDDGINYHYIGRTTIAGNDNTAFAKYTLVETPGISRMRDQTTGEIKDVMFFGIQNWDNGPYYNLVNGEGCVAMLGHIDANGLFIPDNSTQDPNDSTNYYATTDTPMFRTDFGSDYYGGSN
ncbi:hypothetical protein ACQW5G_04920 [Fructilactobacillus sp. Tb1]|uniref:hypothetical protein n=1 Tax=Fructilactobacillus sp. Tb1 TaxID=3422304 RepID=UPI003D284212